MAATCARHLRHSSLLDELYRVACNAAPSPSTGGDFLVEAHGGAEQSSPGRRDLIMLAIDVNACDLATTSNPSHCPCIHQLIVANARVT